MALTEGLTPQDIVKWECNSQFTRGLLTLKTVAEPVKVGSLLYSDTGWRIVTNGHEAAAAAIALEAVASPAGQAILCLIRGPAIVDSTRVNEQCEADVAWSEVAAYLLVLGILGLAEPTKQTVGTPDA